MIRKALEEKQEEPDYSNVKMIFIANPEGSEDPFSKRFVVPYLDDLRRDGIYQDELHTIVLMNYDDNPGMSSAI